MVKKLVLGFVSFALVIASAANSYTVTLYDSVTVNGTMLKPGDYKLELKDNTAVLKQGKTVAQAPVKIQNDEQRFSTNTVRVTDNRVEEIRLGGTHTRVIFEK